MKKKMIPIALFAVLATMSVSCQKENVMDLASETTVAEASTVTRCSTPLTEYCIWK